MRSSTSERNGLPLSERNVPRRTKVATVAFFTPSIFAASDLVMVLSSIGMF